MPANHGRISFFCLCAFFCGLLLWVGFFQYHDDETMRNLKRSEDLFRDWMMEFNKTYSKGEKEYEERFALWLENHLLIEQHNNQYPPPSYLLGHNQFSDMSLQEIHQAFHLGDFSSIHHQHTKNATAAIDMTRNLRKEDDQESTIPDQVDWRPAFGPARAQGVCGSCWAFSAAGAVEGAYFALAGKPIQLSEQQLVDCDTKNSHGCMGGSMEDAFTYDTMGLCALQDYPYVGWRGGSCKVYQQCQPKPNTTVRSYKEVDQTADALLQSIVIQPIAVVVQANQPPFLFYRSGVFQGPCGEKTDHAVLAVGYGTTESGEDYWLVRNSFGTHWGEKGYIRIARDSTQKFGLCGILAGGSRPILALDK